MDYKSPKLTVDGVIIKQDKVLLIKRKKDPFKGMWALPGGFVEYNETTTDAVIREIKEETGLQTQIRTLLGVYSDPKRDPRGHTVSVVYLLEKVGGEMQAADDAEQTSYFSFQKLPPLAFDHEKIISDMQDRKRN